MAERTRAPQDAVACLLCSEYVRVRRPFSYLNCAASCATREDGGRLCAACAREVICKTDADLCPYCRRGPQQMWSVDTPGKIEIGTLAPNV